MPWNQNIPQAGDQLSTSQADILNNFIALQTLIDVNHVDFAQADQGKHKFVTFPIQGAAPVIGATEWAMYSQVSPTSGVSELFLRRGVGVAYPFTESVQAGAGWTRLPSGILLKWGNDTANGLTVITFLVAANTPAFTTVFSIQVTTAYVNALDGDGFVRLNNFLAPWTQFSVYGSRRTTVANAAVTFQYLAIGI